jgi:hypothetical protein
MAVTPVSFCVASAEWWSVAVNGVLALLTFALLVHTIFHNNRLWRDQTRKARTRLLRPNMENRGCIFAPFGDSKDPNAPHHPAFFFRLPTSALDTDALHVEVLAPELWQHIDGAWVARPGWIPASFLWNIEPRQHVQDRIPQNSIRWCVFGFVAKPAGAAPGDSGVRLCLTLTSTSFAGNHMLEPGRYKIRLEITGSNAKATIWDLEFRLSDEWLGDLDAAARRMLVFEEPLALQARS